MQRASADHAIAQSDCIVEFVIGRGGFVHGRRTRPPWAREQRRRYVVVSNAGEANYTLSPKLRRPAQTNEGQAFRYDRAKLIEMLDAAVGEEKA